MFYALFEGSEFLIAAGWLITDIGCPHSGCPHGDRRVNLDRVTGAIE
jgi:hypothetical protein